LSGILLDLENDLRTETIKWLQRAEEIFEKISSREDESERFYTNIAAYIFDSHYFLDRNDLIRAFEAVIWAWAWIEIGQDIGILIIEDDK